MAWDQQRSRARITRLMTTVPSSTIDVRRFDQSYYQQRVNDLQARGRRLGLNEGPIANIPNNKAILVDGVHVYVELIDYHDLMQIQGRESEASHRRLLQALHLHYSATDRVVEQFEIQRVDYHGPRLHAVVVTPIGNERERVLRAVAFATTVKKTIEEAGRLVGGSRLATRVRIGIDTGMAVAVNSGRRAEPEPLFLGSPANHAAKLAEGGEPGIFVSDRVRAVLSERPLGTLMEARASLTEDSQYRYANMSRNLSFSDNSDRLTRMSVDAAVRSLQADVDLNAITGNEAVFRFHHHEPPLRTIRFEELMPSNSIRMPVVSTFADVSGFTAYVDRCIALGRVSEMTANLHVIRGELAECARDDFGARKVRFIGDCIHALNAIGTRVETDEPASVDSAVRLAGGLRSSFNLCKSMLSGVAELGLAIALELGPTPVTRLGIRGERSVRCASSKAVSASEAMQSELGGRQTALGATALASAPRSTKDLFRNGPVYDLDYDAVTRLLSPSTCPAAPAKPAVLSSSLLISQGAAARDAVREQGSGRHA
jgi:class 3 adenylate cyclase